MVIVSMPRAMTVILSWLFWCWCGDVHATDACRVTSKLANKIEGTRLCGIFCKTVKTCKSKTFLEAHLTSRNPTGSDPRGGATPLAPR